MKHVLLLCYCLLLFCGCYEQKTEGKSLEDIANNFNKKCPRMLDSETKIDGIEIRGANTVVYKYTLVNLLAQNVDTLAFRRALWPGILSLIKVSPDLKSLREQRINFEYAYRDQLQKPVYTFKILPGDYNPSAYGKTRP